MRVFGIVLLASAVLSGGAVFAEDDSTMVTGRSVAVTADCDRVTPVCAAMGSHRLVPYDNECHARADGAASVSFTGCFDEN